jgi:ABC-2 type transport system ATP-binding protein
VWEFLDFFAVAYQIARSKRKQVIGDVLELLDLTHKRDDFVNGLSRGMKQRLCLAKTLVHDPPLLILDEPSSGLDPRARLEFKALIKELRNMGKTILISSHILSELADTCTSIGIIERGQLLMHGSIDEVYRKIRRNRIVEIRVADDAQDFAIKVIQGVSEVRDLQVVLGQIVVELEGHDETVAALHDLLVLNKIRLANFHDKDPTLEDVFMLVTKGIVA